MNEQNERSLGTIFKELAEELSTLVRSEVALAKLEIRQSVMAMGIAGAMFAAAAFVSIFAMAFIFTTIALVLIALGLMPWAATLIVAGLLLAVAAVLALIGKSKMKSFNPVPTTAVESIKTDIALLKTDFARLRQRT